MLIELPDNQHNIKKIAYILQGLALSVPERNKELTRLIKRVKNKGLTIELSVYKPHHTRLQENYYRKWCRKFGDFCGLTPDEMHEELLKQCFGTTNVSTKMGIKQRPARRSGRLDTAEYSQLIETLCRVGAEYSFQVPPPATKLKDYA